MKDKKKKSKLRYLPRDIVWAIGYTLGWLVFRPKNYYISEEAKKKIKGGSLIISNHIGFVDPVYLMMAMGYRRQHFIATKEFFSNKFKKFVFEKIFLCICIDRDNVGTATIKTVVNELKDGERVTMFPEGHINFEGGGDEIAAFKSGAVLMALKGGCPIVPVYIHKRKSLWNRQVTIFGEPINVTLEGNTLPIMEYIDGKSQELYKKEVELELFYKQIMDKKNKKTNKKGAK